MPPPMVQPERVVRVEAGTPKATMLFSTFTKAAPPVMYMKAGPVEEPMRPRTVPYQEVRRLGCTRRAIRELNQ